MAGKGGTPTKITDKAIRSKRHAGVGATMNGSGRERVQTKTTAVWIHVNRFFRQQATIRKRLRGSDISPTTTRKGPIRIRFVKKERALGYKRVPANVAAGKTCGQSL